MVGVIALFVVDPQGRLLKLPSGMSDKTPIKMLHDRLLCEVDARRASGARRAAS